MREVKLQLQVEGLWLGKCAHGDERDNWTPVKVADQEQAAQLCASLNSSVLSATFFVNEVEVPLTQE